MHATRVEPTGASPPEHPLEWAPSVDVDSTADLHEEPTSDLPPDASPAEAPSADSDACAPCAPRRPCADPFAPGVVLEDRYLIEALIGSGGVSFVYRAKDLRAQAHGGPEHVALKTPRPQLHDPERARRRLTHEHQLLTALSHPGVVRAFELSAASEPCFMTMELVEGRVLSELLHEGERPLPVPAAQRILRGCAEALAHAHGRNIVHGDFKPGNVLVARDHTVKIIDFGAAAASAAAETRIAAGTPAYASPEVLSGETPEPRDDVFSLACVAYEMLTGRHPFDRRSSLKAREEGRLPPRVWSLSAPQWLTLLSALSWTRDQRPSDIVAFADALTAHRREPHSPVARTGAYDAQGREPADDLAQPQHSWGFFVFLACAFAVMFIATRQPAERNEAAAPEAASQISAMSQTPSVVMGAPVPSLDAPPSLPPSVVDERPLTSSRGTERTTRAPSAEAPRERTRASPPAISSEVAFEATQIVTSESSLAAVFLLRRSPPVTGRARVQWRTESGTARGNVDFEEITGGTVEFMDGQTQRAIYVPLKNDLLAEDDETFTVHLSKANGARLGERRSATATILDDD